MKALEVHDVNYSYDDGTVALKDVTFSVEVGEKVAIVGPNGAGKSTLLHLIAGFRMPFTGSLTSFGRQLMESNADDLRRDLGLVFQDPDDQIFMPTVEEDVAFGPRNLKLGDIDQRVSEALRSAGIEHIAKRRPHRLSHGMKKRVAIAGTLAMDPRMLLLDEPTSGLDSRARSELISLLRSMDRTMLIATHDLEAAAELADRAIVLNVGVVMVGTVRDLIAEREVLEKNGLELPSIPKLFKVMGSMGYGIVELPVSVDEAAAEFTKLIEREGRHARVRNSNPANDAEK